MSTLAIENSTVFVKDAPALPGLNFRGFRGDSDFPLMAGIIMGCKDEDEIERVETAEDIQRGYSHLINCDPYQDMLFAQIGDRAIGYSRVTWANEGGEKMIYIHFGFLLPEWRRLGIGRAMLRYNQDRLRQIAAGQENDLPCFFESGSADTETAAEALLLSEGFSPVRHFYRMRRPDLENIPEAPMPEGLEVRPVEPEHYQEICDAENEAFRDHWGFSDDFKMSVEELVDRPNFDPSLWKVAWDGDQVTGMVRSYIDGKENTEYNRLRGWTEDISVRRPWRKRGLASSLIAQSLHTLKDRGMQEAALGVDTQNLSGALRLYERMGYSPDKRFTNYRKDF
jgi:GNAT superfamily N-acetyltransferase